MLTLIHLSAGASVHEDVSRTPVAFTVLLPSKIIHIGMDDLCGKINLDGQQTFTVFYRRLAKLQLDLGFEVNYLHLKPKREWI